MHWNIFADRFLISFRLRVPLIQDLLAIRPHGFQGKDMKGRAAFNSPYSELHWTWNLHLGMSLNQPLVSWLRYTHYGLLKSVLLMKNTSLINYSGSSSVAIQEVWINFRNSSNPVRTFRIIYKQLIWKNFQIQIKYAIYICHCKLISVFPRKFLEEEI